MARIDNVIAFLRQHADGLKQGISANELATALGIHRSDASAELNRLYKQNQVDKSGTRPVQYFWKSKQRKEQAKNEQTSGTLQSNLKIEEDFSEIVGYDGSIKAQIKLAKAAIVYPPQGLHTLIFGESGVGKNLLAESMWRFAQKNWGLKKEEEIPFVQFCCADYAANEQLLLAQLFGYKKGAFTGAIEDHEGVVARAEGGILFLDEIHRLPAAGQELLFMLIDKGVYRQLGETRNERKARIMIIGATSEDITSNLLMTFRRRIPVQISLPRITERPIRERVNLILHFVRQESLRLGLPVYISGAALQVFANYNCPANIGELRNDVLLCCAKSYLSYMAAASSQLLLDMEHIPQRIFSLVKRQTILDGELKHLFEKGLVVEAKDIYVHPELSAENSFHIDLYGYVDRKLENYRQLGINEEELSVRVSQDLEKYFESVAQVLSKAKHMDIPVSMIEERVWAAAGSLLEGGGQVLERSYGRNTVVALAWHLQQFKERMASGRMIYNPHLSGIKAEHEAAFSFIAAKAGQLEKDLDVSISVDEMGFLAMFLIHGAEDLLKAKIGMVIAAHGRGTAQSMAEVANNLLGTDHIRAYDIPLNRSNVQTVEDLRKVIKEADEGVGVLLLVDMGFLVTMEESLCQETGIEVAVMPNVTTALVLEAGRRVLTVGEPLAEAVQHIYTAYQEYTMTLRQRTQEKNILPPTKVKRSAILLTCATGRGVAEKVKEILVENIPRIKQMHMITLGVSDDVAAVMEKTEDEIVLVLGSVNPGVAGVPFLHVSELFSDDGLNKIARIIEKPCPFPGIKEKQQETCGTEATYELLAGQLGKFLKSLPPERVCDVCKNLVEKIAAYFFRETIEQDAVIRIYLHAACMFDRVHVKESLLEPAWADSLRKERPEDFSYLKKVIATAALTLQMEVPDGEIYYFLSSLPKTN